MTHLTLRGMRKPGSWVLFSLWQRTLVLSEALSVQRPRQHQEGRPVDGLHLEGGAGAGTGQSDRDVIIHRP